MLVEGDFCNNTLEASGVGLAPIESASATRSHFGNENWFGGESPIAYPTIPRLQKINASNPEARIIFVADVWLDDPKVVVKYYFPLLNFFFYHFDVTKNCMFSGSERYLQYVSWIC